MQVPSGFADPPQATAIPMSLITDMIQADAALWRGRETKRKP